MIGFGDGGGNGVVFFPTLGFFFLSIATRSSQNKDQWAPGQERQQTPVSRTVGMGRLWSNRFWTLKLGQDAVHTLALA